MKFYRKIVILLFILLVLFSGSASAAKLTVILVGTGLGDVRGGKISCGLTCEATYEKGTVVQLKAIPDVDTSIFVGWMVNGKPHEGVISIDEEDILIAARFDSKEPIDDIFIHWYNGNRQEWAITALDEVAIFIEPWENWEVETQEEFHAAVHEIEQRFHPQAEVIEQYEDYMMIVKSPEPVPKEQFATILDSLQKLKYVRQVSPVFYQHPDDPSSQIILTDEVEVKYPDFYTENQIAKIEADYELQRINTDEFIQNGFRYRVNEPLGALDIANQLVESGLVEYAYPNVIEEYVLLNSIPDDTYFSKQWHLENTGQQGGTKGEDVNILPAWNTALPGPYSQNKYIRGDGIIIAIVDDGIEITHEDLAPNAFPLSQQHHYDFIDGDDDPTPTTTTFAPLGLPPIIPVKKPIAKHGTAVAGVALARGFNGQGVCGAAPEAHLAGYRILLDGAVKQGLVGNFYVKGKGVNFSYLIHNCRNVHIYNNSWANRTLEILDSKDMSKLRMGTLWGRDTLGSIYVFGAGNIGEVYVDDHWVSDELNSNYNAAANSRYVIAVAASNHEGKRARYSALGANLLVNAPAGDAMWGRPMITTTDRSGYEGYNPRGNDTRPNNLPDYSDLNYTDSFGGTSSAAPLVSGIIALILQANPKLTWRDVQHLLIETAEKNDPTDLDWQTNAAGYAINHKYGFGRIDAAAAVNAALSWQNVPQEIEDSKRPQGDSLVNKVIPDGTYDHGKPLGVEDTITISENIRIEFVELTFSAPHDRWGDLEVILTSPAGTQSVLAEQHYSITKPSTWPVGASFGYGGKGWRFGSFRHFGETSQGDWTLTVRDRKISVAGKFKEWKIKFYGTELPEEPPERSYVREVKVSAGEETIYHAGWEPLELEEGDEPQIAFAWYAEPQEPVAGTEAQIEIRTSEALQGREDGEETPSVRFAGEEERALEPCEGHQDETCWQGALTVPDTDDYRLIVQGQDTVGKPVLPFVDWTVKTLSQWTDDILETGDTAHRLGVPEPPTQYTWRMQLPFASICYEADGGIACVDNQAEEEEQFRVALRPTTGKRGQYLQYGDASTAQTVHDGIYLSPLQELELIVTPGAKAQEFCDGEPLTQPCANDLPAPELETISQEWVVSKQRVDEDFCRVSVMHEDHSIILEIQPQSFCDLVEETRTTLETTVVCPWNVQTAYEVVMLPQGEVIQSYQHSSWPILRYPSWEQDKAWWQSCTREFRQIQQPAPSGKRTYRWTVVCPALPQSTAWEQPPLNQSWDEEEQPYFPWRGDSDFDRQLLAKLIRKDYTDCIWGEYETWWYQVWMQGGFHTPILFGESPQKRGNSTCVAHEIFQLYYPLAECSYTRSPIDFTFAGGIDHIIVNLPLLRLGEDVEE